VSKIITLEEAARELGLKWADLLAERQREMAQWRPAGHAAPTIDAAERPDSHDEWRELNA
jgi:hypothetical protein